MSDAKLKVTLNGVEVVIDPRTLTMRERQLIRSEIAKMVKELGIESDDQDILCGTVWAVVRRTDPTISFGEVADQMTIGTLSDAEQIDGADDPEA